MNFEIIGKFIIPMMLDANFPDVLNSIFHSFENIS